MTHFHVCTVDDCVRGTPNIETCIIISGGHLVGDTCIKTLLWTVLRFVCRGRRCVSSLFLSLVLLGYGHRLELSFAVLKSDNVPTQWVKLSFTFWIKSFLFYFPALRSRRKGRRESKSLIVLHRARGNFGKIRTRGVWCCCCCCYCWFCCNFVVCFFKYSSQPSWKLHQDKIENLRGSLATVVFNVVAVIVVIVDVVVVVAIVFFLVLLLCLLFLLYCSSQPLWKLG